MTQDNNRISKRSPSEGPVLIGNRKQRPPTLPVTHCNEHLQVKMYGLTGILCDSLCHTMASMKRFFFSLFFKFNFVLLGGMQGNRYEGMGR